VGVATLYTAPVQGEETRVSADARATQRKVRAKQAFETGLELAAEGDFVTAKQYFKLAREILPHPAVSYNIALTCRELGELEQALEYLDEALEQGVDRLSDAELENVVQERREVEALLQASERVAESGVDGPEKRTGDKSGAAASEAEPARGSETPGIAPGDDVDTHATTSRLLVGVGATLLTSAGVLYLWNGQRHDDWQRDRKSLATWQHTLLLEPTTTPSSDAGFVEAVDQHNRRLESIRRVDLISAALAGGGVLAAAAGVWLGLDGTPEVQVTLGREVWVRLEF
jgi:tetratricopeptide (TPR) repeat protein